MSGGDRVDGANARPDVFPHDRVVFFSDAVFAIAITLLAIELKPPSEEVIARVGAGQGWGELVPLFIAFFISFMVVGQFWLGHMQTWKYVTRVTGKLVWCSIFQLMFVALMPFATVLYSEAFRAHGPGRFAFYSLVLTGISFFAWLMRKIVVRQEGLVEKLGPVEVRWMQVRGLISLMVFAVSIPLAFVLPTWMGGIIFALIFPLIALAKRFFLRAPALADPSA